jgi:ABC-type transport system involved in multi-copper enzyme maturation permease subunit
MTDVLERGAAVRVAPVSWAGVRTVAEQEFRLRLRAGRWKWLQTGWFVLVAGFTLLTTLAAGNIDGLTEDGVVVFGALTLFVLGLALLVVPSLSAQSVNGDRERGTLASLQVTLLTPWEITLGKFLAAWGTALTFVALTLPMVLFTVPQGGVQLTRVLVVYLLIALLLGAVCAVALWLSSALARTTTSGVLSYLAIGALVFGTLIAFGLGSLASQEHYTQSYPSVDCDDSNDLTDAYNAQASNQPLPDGCVATTQSYEDSRTRTDRIWWLLAPNPFVIVADAAPRLGPIPNGLQGRDLDNAQQARDADVLGQLGQNVRDLRLGPGEVSEDGGGFSYSPTEQQRIVHPGPVWPWGLGFDVLLAGGALWLTARRLRTPTRKLPKGQRVA